MPRKNPLRRRSPISKLYKRMIDRRRINKNLKSPKYNITNINNLSKSKHPNNKRELNSYNLNNYINNSESLNNDKNNLIINENNQFNIIIPVNKIESNHYNNPNSNNVINHVSKLTIVTSTQKIGQNRINPNKYISEKSNLRYKGIIKQNKVEKNKQNNYNRISDIPKYKENYNIIYKKKPTSKNNIHYRKISSGINKVNNNIEYFLKNENTLKTNECLSNRIQTSRKLNRMDKINNIIQLKNKIFNKENSQRKLYSNRAINKIKSQINNNYFTIFDYSNHIDYSNNLFNNNINDNYINSEIINKRNNNNIYEWNNTNILSSK
jgi:hypothetical protein